MKNLTKKMMMAVIPLFMAAGMIAGAVTPINPALDPPKSAAPNPGCWMAECP
jgi:hypothetical protein